MMFLNCQKPGLIKDPYIYKPDSIMLDLEDAVAENQKDAARYSLYHALQEIDYRGVERVVRINGLDTPHWKEDIRVCVAGGADTIRIAKTETAQDVKTVEEHVLAAEKEFGRPEGSTLLMAALESCKGVLNALEVCQSSDRLIGIALSGGDYTKDLQTTITGTGVELMGAGIFILVFKGDPYRIHRRRSQCRKNHPYRHHDQNSCCRKPFSKSFLSHKVLLSCIFSLLENIPTIFTA